MSDSRGHFIMLSRTHAFMLSRTHAFMLSRTPAALMGVALSISVIAAGAAWPQSAPLPPSSLGVQSPAQQPVPDPTPPPQAEPGPAAPPADSENPGLFNEIGKLFDKSKSMLPSLKGPQEAIDDLSRLAKPSSMVTGRAACLVASNGAPDCKAGADRLCQSKGYKEGKSLDTDAAEKCSAKVYLPGYKRVPGDCRNENFVIRALCQ